MCVLEGGDAPVTVLRARAEDPWARPAEDRVPLQPPRSGLERPERVDRLVLGPVRRGRRDVPGEQAALPKVRHVPRERAWEGPSGGLDVPHPEPWAGRG